MREARIILPTGQGLEPAHQSLRRELATRFGGYTATPSFGGWIAPNGDLIEEPGTAYDVACNQDAAPILRAIASRVGQVAHQQAMYLRLPSGDVEIMDTSRPAANAA